MSGTESKKIANASVELPACLGEHREVGKTEAQQGFLQLLNEVRDNDLALTIKDGGEKVAVILGYKQFLKLLQAFQAHGQTQTSSKRTIAGLIAKAGNLDQDKAKVDRLFDESYKRTRQSL